MAAVCWQCIEDEYLKNIIREKGEPDQCSLCDGEHENAFTAYDFARGRNQCLSDKLRR